MLVLSTLERLRMRRLSAAGTYSAIDFIVGFAFQKNNTYNQMSVFKFQFFVLQPSTGDALQTLAWCTLYNTDCDVLCTVGTLHEMRWEARSNLCQRNKHIYYVSERKWEAWDRCSSGWCWTDFKRTFDVWFLTDHLILTGRTAWYILRNFGDLFFTERLAWLLMIDGQKSFQVRV